VAISKTQGATGNGATITLNSVVAGALLTLNTSFYRGTSTAAVEATPTDTAGTFAVAIAPAPILFNTTEEAGASVFYIKSASSGTHTATPQANTLHSQSYTEFAGADTTSPSDVSTSGGTSNTNHTSRTTGTTGTTAQADEVVLIGISIAAVPGVADIGFTDPVVGYTTLLKGSNSAAGIAVFHAFQVISSVGTKTATFNWTDNTSVETSQAVIATFKAAATGGVGTGRLLMPGNLQGGGELGATTGNFQ
jgi:hypothetical protein